MSVIGKDIERLRAKRNWSQNDLADALNAALDRNYKSGSVSTWETGKRNIPGPVAAMVETLLIEANLPPVDDPVPPAPQLPNADDPPPPLPNGDDDGRQDTPPGPGPSAAVALPLHAGIHSRACAELWEIIGTGVGMVGAATGNDALVDDAAIIARDKEKLGAAWGKLAETNDTFRKMLASMTEGGAWMQVAVVTGTTFSRCYQNHAEHARRARTFEPSPGDDEHLRAVS